jgi:predicted ATPase
MPFVGRDTALRRLRAGLDDLLTGRGGTLLVIGQSGIGKSCLADELERTAELVHARVLRGRCLPSDGAPGLRGWMDVLRDCLDVVSDDDARHLWVAAPASLEQLLNGTRTTQGVPSGIHAFLAGSQARFELISGAAAILRRAACERPLVVILDDFDHADILSLQLAAFVSAELSSDPVLLVVTLRELELPESHEHSLFLKRLGRLAHHIDLAPLDAEGTAQLVNAVSWRFSRRAREIHALTDGSPLLIGEALAILAMHGERAPLPIASESLLDARSRLRDP